MSRSVGLTLRAAAHHPEHQAQQRVEAVVDGQPAGGRVLAGTGLASPDGGIPDTVAWETVVVDGLVVGVKVVELWLPQGAVVELASVAFDDPAQPPLPLPPDSRRRWWHHGSSISHCTAADGPLATWPAIAAAIGGVSLTSLGFGGQAMLDPYVARTIRDGDADLVSVAMGVNIQNGATMRARTFGPAVHGFLDTIREGKPDAPLVVISPILFPAGEDRPGPLGFDEATITSLGDPTRVAEGELSVRAIRTMIERIVTTRMSDDARLHYLDGRLLLDTADVALLEDGLHPDAAGYRLMGERFGAYAFGDPAPFGAPG